MLRSNQFRLNLGDNLQVYQYALTVTPDDIFEASVVHRILMKKFRRLYKILGAYVPSGKMIFTLAPIEDTFHEESTYEGKPIAINIDKSTERTI